MPCSVNSEVFCLPGEKNKPRIPHSCKLVENVTFKLTETLIIPGGKRGDIHPLEESMVQTSRVDWSAGEHFKPLPLPGTNLRELLLCPPHCQECAPIDLSVTTIATGTLSTNSSFHRGFLPATSMVDLGGRSGRIQNGGSPSRATAVLLFQRDLWRAWEVTSGARCFFSLWTRLSYRHLHSDKGANQKGDLAERNAGTAEPAQKSEAMARVPGSILCWIFQKEKSLKNHLLYSFSILDTLYLVKQRRTLENILFASNVLEVSRGGQALVRSLRNISKE